MNRTQSFICAFGILGLAYLFKNQRSAAGCADFFIFGAAIFDFDVYWCFSVLLFSGLLKNRMLVFDAKIKQPIDKDSILIVKGEFYADTIDSMIYAQMKGIKTMSGYSGNQPNNYLYPKTCQETENLIKSAEKFSQEKLGQPLKIDRSKIIYVGFEEDCSRIRYHS